MRILWLGFCEGPSEPIVGEAYYDFSGTRATGSRDRFSDTPWILPMRRTSSRRTSPIADRWPTTSRHDSSRLSRFDGSSTWGVRRGIGSQHFFGLALTRSGLKEATPPVRSFSAPRIV